MPAKQEFSITGFQGRPVPGTLVRQDGPANGLAVFFPGFGYTCDMPLFYYAARLLLGRGSDVLQVEYAYNRDPTFGAISEAERNAWLSADASAVFGAVAALGEYERVTVLAKSLGTRALAHVLAAEPPPSIAQAVWLTPLLRDAVVREAIRTTSIPSLVVIGSEDPHYDADVLREATEGFAEAPVVIAGADHSFDIGLDPHVSVRALGQVLAALDRFLTT